MAACLYSDGRMRVAVGSCGPAPLHSDEADSLLSAGVGDDAITRAGEALQALADPLDDVRGSADYRRLLIPRLLLRAVRSLHERQRSAA